MVKLNGAEALVRALVPEQVPYVFGIVGGKLMRFLHALSREPSIRFVGTRHEGAGPLMGAAVYACSGRVAVAIGEMGPGSANLVSGIGGAFNNRIPLVVLTSNQHRAAAYPFKGVFMDLDTQSAFRPLTKWNAIVSDGRRIPELVRTAFREALSGRPGPVHLDVPQDVFATVYEFDDDEFDVPPARYRSIAGPEPAEALVDAATVLLTRAKRPLLVAGGGVVASGATAAFRELASLLDEPAIPTQMALGVIPSASRHFIGHGGIIGGDALLQAFEQADVVLAVGCRFSSWLWDDKGPLVRKHQHLINVNIDSSSLGEPALHEVGIHADARAALVRIVSALKSKGARSASSDWLQGLRETYARYQRKLASLAEDRNPVMHPAALAKEIAAALPRDSLVVYDGGHTTFWSNDFTPVEDVRTRFHEPGMSQLGFGLPHGIALKFVHPEKPVFNITGDGSFGFTLQELDTARRYGLPVINIIHNNQAWGIIKAGQKKSLDFSLGTDLEGTDYAAIAREDSGVTVNSSRGEKTLRPRCNARSTLDYQR
jgi:thiamine pyrophosphate-dependent acetolactate synthase large subunit-like protein